MLRTRQLVGLNAGIGVQKQQLRPRRPIELFKDVLNVCFSLLGEEARANNHDTLSLRAAKRLDALQVGKVVPYRIRDWRSRAAVP